jgi:hypothetical protein
MDWMLDEFTGTETKTAAPPPGRQREPVPEGRHLFEIVRAAEEGSRLKLALCRVVDGDIDHRTGWVWFDPPRDKDWARRLVAGLAMALGLSPGEWNATKASALEGRQLEAEVYHKQGETRLYVNVSAFYRSDRSTPAAKPARKPAAAAAIGDDDIPF